MKYCASGHHHRQMKFICLYSSTQNMERCFASMKRIMNDISPAYSLLRITISGSRTCYMNYYTRSVYMQHSADFLRAKVKRSKSALKEAKDIKTEITKVLVVIPRQRKTSGNIFQWDNK